MLHHLRLELVDKLGNPISGADAGEEFTLNAYTKDLRASATGVFSAYFDVLFDEELVTVRQTPVFATDYTTAQSYDLTTPGLLNEVGASAASLAPLGPNERLLFSTLLRAEQAGTATFYADPADDLPAGDVSVYGQDNPVSPYDIHFGSAQLQITGEVGSWTPGSFDLGDCELSMSAAPATLNESDATPGSYAESVVTVDATGQGCETSLTLSFVDDTIGNGAEHPDDFFVDGAGPNEDTVSLTGQPPNMTGQFTLKLEHDTDAEEESQIRFTVSDSFGNTATTEVTVVDDDNPPGGAITITGDNGQENSALYYCNEIQDGKFTISLNQGHSWSSFGSKLVFTLAGSAEHEVDYEFVSGSNHVLDVIGEELHIIFDSSLSDQDDLVFVVDVTSEFDEEEGDETVTLTGHQTTGTVTITDDAETITFTASDPQAHEQNELPGTFTISGGANQLCSSFRLILNADPDQFPNAAKPHAESLLRGPVDYTLSRDVNPDPDVGLPIGHLNDEDPEVTGKLFVAPEDPLLLVLDHVTSVNVDVLPSDDFYSEGNEIVHANLESQKEITTPDPGAFIDTELEAEVTIIDNTNAAQMPDERAQIDGTSDEQCSCVCIVCGAEQIGASTHSAAVHTAIVPDLVTYLGEGAHGTQTVVRGEFRRLGSVWPDSIDVSVAVNKWDGSPALPGSPPLVFTLDTSSLQDETVAFAVPVDVDTIDTGSYSYVLDGTGSNTSDTWSVETSHVVVNRWKNNDLAPGLTFPFLKQALSTKMWVYTATAPVATDGLAIVRGDNTVSWYPNGSDSAADTISKLTIDDNSTPSTGDDFYVLTDRYGDVDRFPVSTYTESVGGVNKTWQAGRHYSYTDRNGNETRFYYDNNDRLEKISDPFKRETTIVYDQPTGTVTFTDFAGRVSTLVYDSVADTIVVSLPDPTIAGYVSGPQPETTFQLDSQDRLVSITRHANGAQGVAGPESQDQTTSLVYTSSNYGYARQWRGAVTITRPDGSSWSLNAYRQDEELPVGAGWTPGSQSPRTLEEFENVAEVNDGRGFLTKYEIDQRGRVLEIVDAHNQTFRFQRKPAEVDSYGNVVQDRGEIKVITEPDADDFTLRPDLDPALMIDHSVSVEKRYIGFDHDVDSNVTRQRLPKLALATYTLDWPDDPQDPNDGYFLSRPREFINELGQLTLFGLDGNANLDSITAQAPGARVHRGPQHSPWQNPVNRHDIDDSGLVTPVGDVLSLINRINQLGGETPLPDVRQPQEPFLDSSGDGGFTSIDVLNVINRINDPSLADSGHAYYAAPQDAITEYVYSPAEQTSALPNGLVVREKVTTGRTAKLETTYAYFDNPQDVSTYGLLKSVTYAAQDGTLAATVHYEYDGNRNLTKFTDEIGRFTEFKFDQLDRLIRVTSADPDGANPEASLVTEYTYDAFDNVASVTQFNLDPLSVASVHTSCFYYDGRNRPVWMVEPSPTADTTATSCDVNAMPANWSAATGGHPDWASWQGRPITHFINYDGNNNLTSVTDAEGRTSSFAYDHLDRLTKVVAPFVDLFTVTGQIVEAGPVTTYVYDNVGNLWSTTDALGHTTDFHYDAWDRPLSIAEPDPDGGTLRPVTSLQYVSTGYGWIERITDPEDRITESQTDFLGRVQYVSEPAVDSQHPVTWFNYYPDGQLKNVHDAEGNATTYSYDGRARMASVLAPESTLTTYVYDAANQLKEVLDPLSRKTTYDYDGLGRVVLITPPDPDATPGGELSPTMAYTYDSIGNLVQSTDALGHTMTYEYDHLFRKAKATDANGDVTQYTFDLVNNMTSLIDAADINTNNNSRNTTTWEYDGWDRAFRETNESGDVRQYKWDAVGNLRTVTDRNNRLTTYDYDDLYRVTQEQWNDVSSRTFTFGYDLVGNLLSVTDSGATVDYQFTYDDLDRVTSETHQYSSLTEDVVLGHSYDLIGNRESLEAAFVENNTTTKDFLTAFAYDGLYRLVEIVQGGQAGGNAVAGKQVDFAYDAASQLTDIRRYAVGGSSSDLVAHSLYDYDKAGRVTSITHSKVETTTPWNGSGFQTGGDTLAAYFLDYDEGNRLTNFSSWQDGFVATYGYDLRNQLTSASYAAGAGAPSPFVPAFEGYDFEGNGNRTQTTMGATTTAYTTGKDNRLESVGTDDYQYDAEGNRTRKTAPDGSYTEYVWDYRNRLVSVIDRDSGGTIQEQFDYRYDAFDRRIGKDEDDDGNGTVDRSTTWVYDGEHIALEFTEESGSGGAELSHRYLHGPVVDMILADEQVATTSANGDVYWPLTDHLGSVRDVIDNEGTVVNHVVYDSFGNRVNESNSVDFLFGYTGRDWDEDVGLQYNRARWYDPAVGGWISEDPIGFEGDPSNLYRYVGNFTTGATDPDGLIVNFIVGAATGAGLEIAFQVGTNLLVGEPALDINWTDVGVSATTGAFGVGLLKVGEKLCDVVQVSDKIQQLHKIRSAITQAHKYKDKAKDLQKIQKKIQKLQKMKPAAISEATKATVAGAVTVGANKALDAAADYAEDKIKSNDAPQVPNQAPMKENESPWYVPFGMQRWFPKSWGEKCWLLDW